MVLKDKNILAEYKVASAIPSAAVIVSTCLMIFFYPYIVERLDSTYKEIKNYFIKLLITFVFINGVIFVILELSAPILLQILYGDKYLNVLSIFRLLIFNFFLSSGIRKLLGNVARHMGAGWRRIDESMYPRYRPSPLDDG